LVGLWRSVASFASNHLSHLCPRNRLLCNQANETYKYSSFEVEANHRVGYAFPFVATLRLKLLLAESANGEAAQEDRYFQTNVGTNGPIVPFQWTHLLVSFDGQTSQLFVSINGVLKHAIDLELSQGRPVPHVYWNRDVPISLGGCLQASGNRRGALADFDDFRLFDTHVSSPLERNVAYGVPVDQLSHTFVVDPLPKHLDTPNYFVDYSACVALCVFFFLLILTTTRAL
jgi:hypothetical protein